MYSLQTVCCIPVRVKCGVKGVQKQKKKGRVEREGRVETLENFGTTWCGVQYCLSTVVNLVQKFVYHEPGFFAPHLTFHNSNIPMVTILYSHVTASYCNTSLSLARKKKNVVVQELVFCVLTRAPSIDKAV